MSRTHSAGSRQSSPGQSATQILIWIAMTAGKIWASQAENSFHLGRGYVHGEQFSSQPQIDDAPVQSGKEFPNTPTFHPASIDTCRSLSRHRGLMADVGERMGHIRQGSWSVWDRRHDSIGDCSCRKRLVLNIGRSYRRRPMPDVL
jgi:hypothetical protein